MTTVEMDFFAEAERARELDGIETSDHESVDSDEQDDWGNNKNQMTDQHSIDRLCRLPDGDVHFCDAFCPFSHPDKDGNRVCVYTGLVVGRVAIERTDNSTGRSTWSADPDVNSGGPMGGAWRKKRDMNKASATAYDDAKQMDDTEMPKAVNQELAERSLCKRGALCVDEEAPVETGPKRTRISKKDVASHTTRTLLMEEALTIFSKLLGKSVKITVPTLPIDPRLLNRDLLFEAAVRKYCKQTAARGKVPCMDDITNIELAVIRVIKEETEKQCAFTCEQDRVHSIHFRAAAARLAVSLWSGACSTPYLAKSRRGADSFRPFCAGVYYGLKRGISLADGTILVPKLDEFSKALPTQRAIAADSAAKSLHASSHRGLCTLHRTISSVNPKQATVIFGEAIRACKAF